MSVTKPPPTLAPHQGPAGPPARPRARRRLIGKLPPYALIAPTVIVLAGVLGYPLVRIVILSLQHFDADQLIGGDPAKFVGLANFKAIFTDGQFWVIVLRTIVFTLVNVVLTMLIGVAIALLQRRVSTWVRLLITGVLVFTWAMPRLVSTVIFRWLVDFDYGVVNWLLSRIPGLGFPAHNNWFTNPIEGFGVITAVVVWGALPFVVITCYAGLTQVPDELIDAAKVDGASAWQAFRNVTLPILRPVLVMVTALEVIWDFQVFDQVWAMRNGNPEPSYRLLLVYSFQQSFQKNNFAMGSAIAIVTVLLLIGVLFFYTRQMLRIGEES
jgi:N,N'-diacetylchitobiose transport system permease protein